jgi:hypothetical protein
MKPLSVKMAHRRESRKELRMHLLAPLGRVTFVVQATVGMLLLLLANVHAGPPFFFCESFPDPPGRERFQGWGSDAVGSGPNGTVIHVGQAPSGCNPPPPPTEVDLINAILLANTTPNPTIEFPPNATIYISDGPGPPPLTASNVTIHGNGATIRGDAMDLESSSGRMFEIRGNNVILRDLHFRNGGNDNLRIQGPNAYRIVISHITSTGAGDDGITISNRCIGHPWRCSVENIACDQYDPDSCPGTQTCIMGCPEGSDTGAPHDITIQFSFFAGNTRSMFLKANVPWTSVNRVSVHHNWFLKQWVRGPLVEKSDNVDYVNNVVEDWAEWGLRFDSEAKGNVVYNVFKQTPKAVELGRMVDPNCRVSEHVCEYNGAPGPNCSGNPDPDFCCDYILGDPLMNNQMKGFNLGDHIAPENVYTNVGTTHTNWYLRRGLKAFDGTAPAPFGVCQLPPREACQTGAPCGPGNACELPEVLTLHQYGDLQEELQARTGPCVLTQAQIDAWTAGQEVKCPRHAIDEAYMEAEDWCVNRKHPFRPPGF